MTCAAYRCPSSGSDWMSRTAAVSLDAVDVPQPGLAVALRDRRQEPRQHVAQVADERDVDRDVLVDLRRVDLDVDLARVRRVGLQVAGDAVVEAHPGGDQQIRLLDRVVDPRLAVHAHHAEVERMRRRQAADPEQRHRDRNLSALRERLQLIHRPRNHHAVPREDHRPLRLVEERGRPGNRRRRALRASIASPARSAPRPPSRTRTTPAARPW